MSTGVFLGVFAFIIWGVLPIYLKQMPSFSAYDITAYRIVLSCFIILLLNIAKLESFLQSIKKHFFSWQMYLCSFLIGINWLLFVIAVENNKITEASFGYFAGPIFNMILGILIFKEKLSFVKGLAIALSFIGVSIQAFTLEGFPWLAITLSITFASYGLTKKVTKIPALEGLFCETLILLIPCFIYILQQSKVPLSSVSHTELIFLLGSGVISITPLYLFSKAAPLIPFMTLGFLQYIAPSLQFICGFVIYQENLSPVKLYSFIFIWAACFLITVFNRPRIKHERK